MKTLEQIRKDILEHTQKIVNTSNTFYEAEERIYKEILKSKSLEKEIRNAAKAESVYWKKWIGPLFEDVLTFILNKFPLEG